MSVAPQPALTVRQLAAYLSVNEKTVYRGTRREETPLLVLNAGGVVAHIFAAALAVFFVLAAASTAQATPSFTGLSRGSGVSGDGTVVVGFTNRGGPQPFSAFIWDTANGMRELDEVLTALGLDLAGWTLTFARALSSDGSTIVGYGINPHGDTEAWVAVIPPAPIVPALQPTALIGLALLLLALAMAAARRRSSPAAGPRWDLT